MAAKRLKKKTPQAPYEGITKLETSTTISTFFFFFAAHFLNEKSIGQTNRNIPIITHCSVALEYDYTPSFITSSQ